MKDCFGIDEGEFSSLTETSAVVSILRETRAVKASSAT